MIRGWVIFALSALTLAAAPACSEIAERQALEARMARLPPECAERFGGEFGLIENGIMDGDAFALTCAVEVWDALSIEPVELFYIHWRVTGVKTPELEAQARALEQEALAVRIYGFHMLNDFLAPFEASPETGCTVFDEPARRLILTGQGPPSRFGCFPGAPRVDENEVEALMERMERFPPDCAARFPQRRGLADAVDAGDAFGLHCAIEAWGDLETQAFELRYIYWRVTGQEPAGLDAMARDMEREALAREISFLHDSIDLLAPIPFNSLTGCERFDAKARALIDRGQGPPPRRLCNRFGY